MQIESSFAAHIKENKFTFTVMGDKAGGSWDPAEMFTDLDGTMVNLSPNFLPDCDFGKLFVIKLQNWIDAIRKGTPLTAPGTEGLMVQKILDGIYRSAAAGGKEVKID